MDGTTGNRNSSMTTAFDPKNLDPQKIIDLLMKNPVAGGAVGGLAGSVLGSLLMGKGGGKKLAKTAVKAGGLALVGAVAWKAWQQYQQSQQAVPGQVAQAAQPPRLPAAFDLESPGALASGSTLRVVRAMVAAAKADGVVDAGERQRILQRVEEASPGAEGLRFVEDLLARPLDLDAVVQGVDCPELAAEVYVASALAVHPASRTERGYLDLLSARLGLEPGLARQIDQGVTAALESPEPAA